MTNIMQMMAAAAGKVIGAAAGYWNPADIPFDLARATILAARDLDQETLDAGMKHFRPGSVTPQQLRHAWAEMINQIVGY